MQYLVSKTSLILNEKRKQKQAEEHQCLEYNLFSRDYDNKISVNTHFI